VLFTSCVIYVMCYLRSVRLYPQLLVGGVMCYLRSVRLYPQLLVGGLMSERK
jgi:hypothetical protein